MRGPGKKAVGGLAFDDSSDQRGRAEEDWIRPNSTPWGAFEDWMRLDPFLAELIDGEIRPTLNAGAAAALLS